MFIEKCFPSRSIDKMLETEMEVPRWVAVKRKPVYISPTFKGDILVAIAQKRLTNAINKTFYTVKLQILFKSRPVVSLWPKIKVPESAPSFCIYSFACSYGAMYIGLSERIHEHHLPLLGTRTIKSLNILVV